MAECGQVMEVMEVMEQRESDWTFCFNTVDKMLLSLYLVKDSRQEESPAQARIEPDPLLWPSGHTPRFPFLN